MFLYFAVDKVLPQNILHPTLQPTHLPTYLPTYVRILVFCSETSLLFTP